jgi:HEAT repeat protein
MPITEGVTPAGDTSSSVDPERSLDPADQIEFVRPSPLSIQRFDQRSEDDLAQVASHHPDALERERALWELADRRARPAYDVLKKAIASDQDPRLRQSALWAAQKFSGSAAGELFKIAAADDPDLDVKEWAALLGSEGEDISRSIVRLDKRPIARDESNPFDQTLPLLIAG